MKTFGKYFLRFTGRRFFYLRAGCLGVFEGSGTFRRVQNRLELRFEQSAADTTELLTRPGQPGDPATTFRFRVQTKIDGRYAGEPGVLIASLTTHRAVRTDQQGRPYFSTMPR